MANRSDTLKQALDSVSSSHFGKADWVGFREVREVTTERYIRDGKPQGNDTCETHGVMAEVLVDGQFGYASTPRLDPESLVAAAQKARTQAEKAARYAIHRFSAEQRPRVTSAYESPVKNALPGKSPGELNELLVQISEKLKISPKIIRTEAFARTVEMDLRFVSSNGSEASQTFSLISTDFQATAQDGPVVQKRTNGGLRGRSYQGGWEYFLTPTLWDDVRRVAEQALELVAAPECPTAEMDLVLAPDQMMLQIHESIGHPLEIDRILGDERNYAGWSFVNLEDFGKLQYGSQLMNVTFDPTVAHEFASYAFDDIGNPARREYLIRDGLLVRGLGSLESQARARSRGHSHFEGVANQRSSSWNRAPIDRMANINLEPGPAGTTFEKILGEVQDGVWMESNRSWSIDDFRNKFQFGCEFARRIRGGKLAEVVRNPNYRGVTVPFWTRLKRVGDTSTVGVYGTPYCGKGEPNQAIRVGHSSPVCLFEKIEVFGGAS